MRCAKVKRKITAYLDGEMSTVEKDVFMLHINKCESCRKELKNMEYVTSLLNPVPQGQPSPGFYYKIQHAVKSKPAGNIYSIFNLPRAGVWSGAFALLAVLILGGYLGGYIVNYKNDTPSHIREIKYAMGLSVFEDTPDDSFGMSYNNMLEEKKQ